MDTSFFILVFAILPYLIQTLIIVLELQSTHILEMQSSKIVILIKQMMPLFYTIQKIRLYKIVIFRIALVE